MTVPRARRLVQIGLGLLWLLDGALQLQPYMFGSGFARGILAPAGQGQPAPVSASVAWAAHLVLTAPAVWNALFAVAQLAIGAAILYRPSVRLGLAASIGWAGGVWWFGEGAGGVFSGQADLLTGAPGAVLLYLLVALCVWPARGGATSARWSARGVALARGLWAAVWVAGALLRLLPAQRSGAALADGLTAGAGTSPGWVSALGHDFAHAAAGSGLAAPALVAGLYLLIAAAPFAPPLWRGVGLGAGAAAGLVIWAVGEGFGGLTTGQSTDPNSGPLLALLAAAVAVRLSGAAPAVPFRPIPVLLRGFSHSSASRREGVTRAGTG